MHLHKDRWIVVTGAAGLIGSGIIKQLNEKGFTKIVAVDEFDDSEKWKNLVGKKFGEILNSDQLLSWLNDNIDDVETFIHMGACSDTTETDSEYLIKNNTQFSQALCSIAIDFGCQFLYASSAATYGDGSKGFDDSHHLIDQYKPLNMYAYSKHLFDQWIQDQGLLDHVCGVKYFNVFGPNEYHKEHMASAILRMVPQAIETQSIKLFKSDHPDYNDGEQKRDFIYIKDAAAMTLSLLESNSKGIYNIGTGQAQTWNDLAQAVIDALNSTDKYKRDDYSIEYIDMPEHLKGKYQYFTEAKVNRIQEALGNKFSVTSLSEAVKDYVVNYLIPGECW